MKKLIRFLSLVMAVAMFTASAMPTYAFEELVDISNVTDYGDISSSEEQKPPEDTPSSSEDSSSDSSEDGNAFKPDQDDSESNSTNGETSSSSQPDTEEPPIVDSGNPPASSEFETLPDDPAQRPNVDPTVDFNGLDPPPDGYSFEASGSMMKYSRSAGAGETITIYMSADKTITHRYPFSGGNTTQYGYIFTTSDGQAVYCVEPARFNSNNGTVVTGSTTFSGLSTAQQKEVAKAIAANTSGAGNHAMYFATQAIIWEIAYGQSARSGSVYDAVIKENIDKLGSAYETIRTKMKEGGEIPSFMSPDPENATVHEMDDNGGTWSIDLKNTNSNVTLRASDFKSRAPFKFSVHGDTLSVELGSQPDQDAYVEWHGGSEDIGLIFWISDEQAKAGYDTTKGIPADGYMAFFNDFVPPTDSDTPNPQPESALGYLTIVKYDAKTNLPLGGSIFSVKSKNYKNDAVEIPYGGKTIVIPIPEGENSVDVEISEVTAPDGYVKDDTPKKVTVTANDTVNIVEVGFANYPKECSLTIYKYEKGEKDIPLQGAQFEIRYADPNVSADVWVKTTDDTGTIHIDLPHDGTLVCRELSAPAGYVIGQQDTYTITVQKGEDKTLNVPNDKKADIIVTKRDNQSGQVLAGAVIKATLLRSHTEPHESGLIYTRTTGSDGRAVFKDMIPGEYRIEESAPPQFFLPTDVVHTVNVYDGSHEPVELEFRNDPYSGLTIHKVDATDSHGLQGAIFKLYEGTTDESTKFLGDFQSNENGIVVIENLKSNTYYTIFESQAPYGYFLDREHDKQTILIKPDALDQNLDIYFRNMPKPKLRIIKINEADETERLGGAVFRVAKKGSQEYVDVETGPDGTVLLEGLEEGWYTVFERRSPTGFVLDEQHYDIMLEAGKTSELIVKNRRKPTLVIEKLDSMTLQSLSGVVYEISIKDGKSLGQFTTGPDGRIVLEDVEPGLTYLIHEVQPLPGYLLDDTVHEARLDTNQTVTIPLVNVPEHPILIEKRDAITGEPIPDTTFQVTKVTGEFVGEYTTGSNGIAVVAGENVVPGWYQVREIKANSAYIPSNETKNVELKYGGEPAAVLFYNKARTGLQIQKIDSVSLLPIEHVGFEILEINGESLGIFYTDASGLINLPDQAEKWVQIVEVKPREGYKPDPVPRLVKLESGKLHIEKYLNKPYPILDITKVNEKGQPMEGVRIKIMDKLHREIGIYTTNAAGKIVLSGMDGGQTIYAQEVETLPGYELDQTEYEAVLSWGKTFPLRIVNKPKSTFRLIKLNALTKKPIFNVLFNLYDSKNNLIGEYTTDDRGIIEFPQELPEGTYKLKEIRAEGYAVDPTIRTIKLRAGETTELTLENRPIMGNIQIIKKASEENPITKDKAGALLKGAVFEIYNTRGEVVDRITTDSRGQAISKDLPMGVFGIREIASPDYYFTEGEVFYAELKVDQDLVRFEVKNKPKDISVTIEKCGNVQAMPGDVISYSLDNIANTSNISLEEFYVHDLIPTDAVRVNEIATGVWSEKESFKVLYRTNKKKSYRVLEDHLSTTSNNVLECGREALGLAANEYVTDIKFVFDEVSEGFHSVDSPIVTVTVLGDLPDGYRITNRADVGGRTEDEWVYAKDAWTTCIFAPPRGCLPKTGFSS